MKLLLGLTLVFSLSAIATPIVIETTMGNIEVELDDEKAPLTVKNFLEYVDTNFYTGTIVHRVVKNFVVQAGGLNQDMTQKPPYAPIQNEATNGLSNVRGTISMARTNDIHSGSSHFFINTIDNTRLDHQPGNPNRYGYAVFGKVTEGMHVIDAMNNVETQTVGEFNDVPVAPITILMVRRK